MHDPRVGRFFARDPLSPKYPHNSPYAFSENRVIDGIELEGLEVQLVTGIVGGVVGFSVELGGQMFANYCNGKPVFEKIDWADVLISTGEGVAIGVGVPPSVAQGLAASAKVGVDYTQEEGVKIAGYNKKSTKVMSDVWEESLGLATGGVISNSKILNKLSSSIESKVTTNVVESIASGRTTSAASSLFKIKASGSIVDLFASTTTGTFGEIGNGMIEDKLDKLNSSGSIKNYDHSKINRDYTIKKGDTLGELAKKFGRSVNGIAHQNKIIDPDKIEVGQKIKL